MREKPNFLVVLTDDQGWGDVTSHSNPSIRTPVMDAFAASGARFDRFFVCPVCAPTRASILTGRVATRTGVTGLTRCKEAMRPSEVTIARTLRDAGYATGCFGKWHSGAHYPLNANGRGFDECFGFNGGHWNNYFDTVLERNGEPEQTTGYMIDVLTDEAIGFMEPNRDRPFLCYVPYNVPHLPFQVPDRYFDRYKADGLDDALACIYGMCENVDDNFARLLGTLDRLGIAGDTVVMFLSDNGPHTNRYNGGMRGRKGSLHEGGTRVPFFIRVPGTTTPGKVVRDIAAHVDLYPTILDLAGLPAPEGIALDGRSLVGLLRGQRDGWEDRVLWDHWHGWVAYRDARYRSVINFDTPEDPEIYDLTKDPGETTNVAHTVPELTRSLRKRAKEWYRSITKLGLEVQPIPVGHPEWPRTELPAHEAYLSGDIEYSAPVVWPTETPFGWVHDWITNWTSTDAFAYWNVDVAQAGEFDVSLLYACTPSDVGAVVRIEASDQQIDVGVDEPHDPAPVAGPDRVPRLVVPERVWKRLDAGTILLRRGVARVSVRAVEKPGPMVMDLKALVLGRLKS